jgi:hypothetical protein
MYHAILVEDLLMVLPQTEEERQRLIQLLGALAPATHPDGEIALFNDSALGVVPSPVRLRRLAGGLGVPALPRSIFPRPGISGSETARTP